MIANSPMFNEFIALSNDLRTHAICKDINSSLDVEKYFAAEKEFMDFITNKVVEELMCEQQSFSLSSEYDTLTQICDCLIVVSKSLIDRQIFLQKCKDDAFFLYILRPRLLKVFVNYIITCCKRELNMEIVMHKNSLFAILPSLLNKYLINEKRNNINNITEYLNIENYTNCKNENDISTICNIVSSILIYHLYEESLLNDKNEILSFSNLIASIFSANQNYIYLSLSFYFFDQKNDYSYGLNLLLSSDELLGIKEREMILMLLKEISIEIAYTYINSINTNEIDVKLIFDILYEISINRANYHDNSDIIRLISLEREYVLNNPNERLNNHLLDKIFECLKKRNKLVFVSNYQWNKDELSQLYNWLNQQNQNEKYTNQDYLTYYIYYLLNNNQILQACSLNKQRIERLNVKGKILINSDEITLCSEKCEMKLKSLPFIPDTLPSNDGLGLFEQPGQFNFPDSFDDLPPSNSLNED